MRQIERGEREKKGERETDRSRDRLREMRERDR